ncbi:MAG: methionyl-tRNA formyltransferase [Vicinamibacteria bacterium]|nr:methionyl-tRNA formyltransferase [Vicinamibacteria bacterium]
MRVRIVFFGTGRFAVPSLRALLDAGHDVAALVAQPDRPAGRGLGLHEPPTKALARERGVPVLQPERVKRPEALEALRAFGPRLQVVVAYGQILPRSVIDLAPLGTVNVHGSLLPRWRGAAPIQWAIAAGDAETGVSTMLIDEGLDTGPVLLRRATAIGPEETAAELEPRLAELGAELLLETVRGLDLGTLAATPQDHAAATHARLLAREDGVMDFAQPARALFDRLRGFSPWPGAVTRHAGRGVKVLRARPQDGRGTPGEILACDREGVLVACGEGALRLLEVQPESRKAMTAAAWAAGARLATGQRLG